MIDGNANDFLNKLYYEDHYVIFNDEKYFFNGCQCQKDTNGNIINVRLEVYNLSKDKTVFSTVQQSADKCISIFENAPIWNGKNFWEAENSFKWVDE